MGLCWSWRPGTVTFSVAGKGYSQYYLYLPLYGLAESVEIGIPEGNTISSMPHRTTKPIVFYGTSITQGGKVANVGSCAVAVCGRNLDMPVINLGFSGAGRMEIEIAEFMAEIDASLYMSDCEPNMTTTETNQRTALFVAKLRELKPNVPILLSWETRPENEWVPSTEDQAVTRIYDSLKATGFEKLYLLKTSGILGTDDHTTNISLSTVDGQHLTSLGGWRQGQFFTTSVASILAKFTSSSNDISVEAGNKTGYKITYTCPNNAFVTILNKPSWISISNDSMVISAPASSCVDSVILQLKSSGIANTTGHTVAIDTTVTDTLNIKITVTGGTNIKTGNKNHRIEILPVINSSKQGLNITLPSAGNYNINVYDINGKVVWNYKSKSSNAGNHFVPWSKTLKFNNVYIATLEWNNKKISQKIKLSQTDF